MNEIEEMSENISHSSDDSENEEIFVEKEENLFVRERRRMTKGNSVIGERLTQNEQVTLEWENIGLTLTEHKLLCFSKCKSDSNKTKNIITNINGTAEPSRLMAIMGASGAGKTTLLNIISKRLKSKKGIKNSSEVNGVVKVNGKEISFNQMRKISAYVVQSDALLPFLTVSETLRYSIEFHYGPFKSRSFKKKVLEDVLNELGLYKVKDQQVGDDFHRGISGGEKRRLSVAIQLITNPRIIFLDEPTSGLDSKTALSLMETLWHIAHDSDRIVISTIHQPRARIFKQFDELLLIAKGGNTVYSGAANESLDYFDALGYPSPPNENPADYLIDLITEEINDEDKREETKERVDFLIDNYREKQKLIEEEEGLLENGDFEEEKPKSKIQLIKQKTKDILPVHKQNNEHFKTIDYSEGEHSRFESVIRWFSEVFWVAHREGTNLSRNRMFIGFRFISALVMSIFVSILFFQMDNNQSTINDRGGLLFFITINGSFSELLAGISFMANRLIFYRDREAGFYRVSSFYIGKLITELPLGLLIPCLYLNIIYWSTGLQVVWYKYGMDLLLMFSVTQVAHSAATVISCIFPLRIASLASPIFLIFNMLFGGLFVNTDNLPDFFSYFQYVTFIKYGYTGFMQVEFTGLDLVCEDDEYIEINSGYGYNNATQQICPITEGEDVLESRSLDDFTAIECVGILCIFYIFFRILAYLILKFHKPKE